MPFLSSAKHDVFISYAHVDNIPDRKDEKGWVELFEYQLNVRLLKRFGEPVDLWRDPELSRAQLFDPVIEQAVRGSGVMISLITPRYLKSDYCRQEITWFREKAQAEPAGLVVDNYLRIFPALLYNFSPNEWPEECQGSSGFPFHDAEGEEFGEPHAPASERFQAQLRRLVEELHTVLMMLKKKESVGPTHGPAETPQEPPFRVFLACPADDLRPCRRHLVGALSREGITVLESIPPPNEEPKHTEAVRKALTEADLSVHLLGKLPGEAIAEDVPGTTYLLEQVRIGLEHAQSQLILMTEEFDLESIEDSTYVEFIRNLRERKRDTDRFELVQTGQRQMLEAILTKRRRIEEARRRAESPKDTVVTAFIDLHVNDVLHAGDLVAYLGKRGIAPIMIPSSDLMPTSGMTIFEENLKRSRLFIVVFGTVKRHWVENRLTEAFKLILTNRLSTRIGVYVAPPRKPREELAFPSQFDIADNMERFNPVTLDPLLQKTVEVAP